MFTNWQKITTAALGILALGGAAVCYRYGIVEASIGLTGTGFYLIGWVKQHWTDVEAAAEKAK